MKSLITAFILISSALPVYSRILWCTGNNVRVRKAPHLKARIITTLIKGVRVRYLEKGKQQKIGNHNEPWYRIKLIDDQVGWVYGAWLSGTMPEFSFGKWVSEQKYIYEKWIPLERIRDRKKIEKRIKNDFGLIMKPGNRVIFNWEASLYVGFHEGTYRIIGNMIRVHFTHDVQYGMNPDTMKRDFLGRHKMDLRFTLLLIRKKGSDHEAYYTDYIPAKDIYGEFLVDTADNFTDFLHR